MVIDFFGKKTGLTGGVPTGEGEVFMASFMEFSWGPEIFVLPQVFLFQSKMFFERKQVPSKMDTCEERGSPQLFNGLVLF